MISNDEKIFQALKNNGVVVMPTDTIYGIVGCAQNTAVVLRIYKMRKRNPKKPCIILIGDVDALNNFSIILNEKQKTVIEKYWSFDLTQGPQLDSVSVVFDCPYKKFTYLHRGTKTLAFRLPASQSLRNLLLKTGPLIAPSANLEALPPSRTISEAKEYFGDSVDLYVDGGTITNKASKVIKLNKDGSVNMLRT